MAISLAEINKLRQKTQAGLMDCKKALTEANGDMEAAMDILRKKGQLVAAKRSDREASEGCVLAKVDGNFAAMIALKCETDFVAKNADFVALATKILDAAVANKCKTLDEVKALSIDGTLVPDLVTERSGVTGEKMELDGYNTVEGEFVCAYNHMNQNFLCTLVAMNKACDENVAKKVKVLIGNYGSGKSELALNFAMQAAAMAPVALNEASVPQSVKDSEMAANIEKAKQNQINKAIEARASK